MTFIDIAKTVADELKSDGNVLAVLLYGSVAKGKEKLNSDIDLLVLTKSYQLEKTQVVRGKVMIEFLWIHEDFLLNFINHNEVPIMMALSEGIVLLDKDSKIKDHINMCQKKVEEGPKNVKFDSEEYQGYIRSVLTELYKDLFDVDLLSFNYMSSELIRMSIPLLYHQNGKWLKCDKEVLAFLKTFEAQTYEIIKKLLDQTNTVEDRLRYAGELVEKTLKAYGGMVSGNHIVFRKTSL